MDFLEELQRGVMVADGAMGTLLMQRGVPAGRGFEELCLSAPEQISQVHADYLAAGARLIRTNTFGANAMRLDRFGLERRVSEINWTAAQLARDCTRGKDAFVAGSVGPLGLAPSEFEARREDAEEIFTDQIGALLDGGVQLIVFETFTNPAELALALRAKQSLHHGPAICLLVCTAEGRLFSGEPLSEALASLLALGADLIGINCVPVREVAQALRAIPPQEELAVFPSAGLPMAGEGTYPDFPDDFARAASELPEAGARVIGGCCGTTPAHIAAAKRVFDGPQR